MVGIIGALPSFVAFVWPLLLSVWASNVVLDFSKGLRTFRGESVGLFSLLSGSTPNLLRATRFAIRKEIILKTLWGQVKVIRVVFK